MEGWAEEIANAHGTRSELEGFDLLLWEIDRHTLVPTRISGALCRKLADAARALSVERPGVLAEILKAVATDGLPRACHHVVQASDSSLLTMYSQVVATDRDRLSAISFPTGERLHVGPRPEAKSEEGEPRLPAEQAETVLNELGEGVLVQTADGRMLFANRAARDLLGEDAAKWESRDSARQALLARFEICDQDGKPLHFERMPTAEARRGLIAPPTTIQWRNAGKQEAFRWASVRATPVFDEEGRVRLVTTIWHDITEERRRQESLAFQNTVLETQTEASPDGILVVSSEGKVLSYNRRFREIWGLDEGTLEERSDTSALEAVLPKLEDPQRFLSRVEALYGSDEVSEADELRLKDGRILERYSSPLISPEGHRFGRIWFFRDVTETRRALERERLLEVERATRAAAERSQRSAALLAEASRILSGSFDVPALLQALTAACATHFRAWVLADILRPDGTVLRVVAPPASGLDRIARELEKRAPQDRAILEGRFPSGEPEVVMGMPELLQYGLRRLPWLVAVWDDEATATLSRMKLRSYLAVPIRGPGGLKGALTLAWQGGGDALSQERHQLVEDLGTRIGLAVENADLYQSVRQAVATREEFLSIASHELRTPIATLQLIIQSIFLALSKPEAPELPEWAVEKLRMAERQARRLGTLVSRLLDVTRLMTGRIELEPQEVDLREVVHDAVLGLEEELSESGSTLSVDAPKKVVGRWDRSRMEQLVVNLVSNAIKYGQGRPIDIRLRDDGESARLEIVDRGMGMSEETRGRIFQRFERGMNAQHISGFGLGLYVVSQIVEAMNGRIEVQSSPGAGSTFRVSLPLGGKH